MMIQAAIFGLGLLGPWSNDAASDQAGQRQLAERVLSADLDEQGRALQEIQAAGIGTAGPTVRDALIKALDREASVHRRRQAASRKGEPLDNLANPERLFELARLVTELREPLAIPALAGTLGTGMGVVRALVAFGEPAAGPVIRTVASAQTHYDAVDDGLVTLRMLVEMQEERPLDPGTMNQIRGVAAMRLNAPGYELASTGVTLRRAIDLAVVLNDPQLRQTVEGLASDPDEVRARGVRDPVLID